jgi:hypothetical protein
MDLVWLSESKELSVFAKFSNRRKALSESETPKYQRFISLSYRLGRTKQHDPKARNTLLSSPLNIPKKCSSRGFVNENYQSNKRMRKSRSDE